jgi:hypothetical protein
MMKPTMLKPGDKVIVAGVLGKQEMTFLRRDKHNRQNWFQCELYRGLDGPDDDGKCYLNDYRVSRDVTRKAE